MSLKPSAFKIYTLFQADSLAPAANPAARKIAQKPLPLQKRVEEIQEEFLLDAELQELQAADAAAKTAEQAVQLAQAPVPVADAPFMVAQASVPVAGAAPGTGASATTAARRAGLGKGKLSLAALVATGLAAAAVAGATPTLLNATFSGMTLTLKLNEPVTLANQNQLTLTRYTMSGWQEVSVPVSITNVTGHDTDTLTLSLSQHLFDNDKLRLSTPSGAFRNRAGNSFAWREIWIGGSWGVYIDLSSLSAQSPVAVYGNAGADFISGSSGDDWINGGPGNDHIDGGPGNDVIMGGTDSDSIQGSSGGDWIDGGPDDDDILGGPGADTLTGGEGYDLFNFEWGDSPAVTAINLGRDGVLNNGDTFSFASGVDLITDFSAGERIILPVPVPWLGYIPHDGKAPIQGFYVVRGNYADRGTPGSAGTFSVDSTGKDALIVWDGDPDPVKVTQTGIVLSGVIPEHLALTPGWNGIDMAR